MGQVRNNQKEMQNIVEEAIKSVFSTVKIPDFFKFGDLSKKVDDLSEKIQNTN